MRCLEVAVNGERFCRAGADHVPWFCASVRHGGPDDSVDHDQTSLTVHGLSGDARTEYYWGAQRLSLSTGDVVTIRIVTDVAGDNPTTFPAPSILAEARERIQGHEEQRAALRESFTELDLSALEQQRRPSLKTLLFWLAVVILGLALWFLVS